MQYVVQPENRLVEQLIMRVIAEVVKQWGALGFRRGGARPTLPPLAMGLSRWLHFVCRSWKIFCTTKTAFQSKVGHPRSDTLLAPVTLTLTL